MVVPGKVMHKLGENLKSANLKKNLMSDNSRGFLYEYYRSDIVSLENLIGRDLSHWKKS